MEELNDALVIDILHSTIPRSLSQINFTRYSNVHFISVMEAYSLNEGLSLTAFCLPSNMTEQKGFVAPVAVIRSETKQEILSPPGTDNPSLIAQIASNISVALQHVLFP
jgi:hypothetical protein